MGDAELLERFVPFVQYDSLESYAADSVATNVEQKLIPDLLNQIDAASGAKALKLCQQLLIYQPDLKAGFERAAKAYEQNECRIQFF